jgi:membrane-associated protease RseP (regulator of RpoE activity)
VTLSLFVLNLIPAPFLDGSEVLLAALSMIIRDEARNILPLRSVTNDPRNSAFRRFSFPGDVNSRNSRRLQPHSDIRFRGNVLHRRISRTTSGVCAILLFLLGLFSLIRQFHSPARPAFSFMVE